MATVLVATLCIPFWIGAAVALSRAEVDRRVLPALLLLPLGFVAIGQGVHDFALGLPTFLLFAAFWRRLDERRDFLVLGGTAACLSALALTDTAALVAAGLLVTADALERALAARRRFDPATAGRLFALDAAWMAVAGLPCLLIVSGVLPVTLGGLTAIGRPMPEAADPFGQAGWAIALLPPALGALAVAGGAVLRRTDLDDLLWPICLVLVSCVSACLLATAAAPLGARLVPFAWITLVLAFARRRDESASISGDRPAVPAKDVVPSAVPDLAPVPETSSHVSA